MDDIEISASSLWTLCYFSMSRVRVYLHRYGDYGTAGDFWDGVGTYVADEYNDREILSHHLTVTPPILPQDTERKTNASD